MTLPWYPVAADPLPLPETAVSEPQSASATLPVDTGCPRATRPVTAVPVESPFATPARAVACACATMSVAVISPLKTLRLFTSVLAVAFASTSVEVEALAFAEPVLTIGSCVVVSSPYVKPPLNST